MEYAGLRHSLSSYQSNYMDSSSTKLNNNHTDNNNTKISHTLPKSLQITRGFSKVQANEDILNETRHQIESNLFKTNEYSFMLPDLNKFDDYKFKEYLHSDLIELPTQCALSESGHLNWWTQGDWEGVCRPLYPMCTSGDGNCLLHAASLAMWGLHDRYLVLRKALHSTLENIKENQSALWRRWRWEQMCQHRKYGLIYSEEEWSNEWKSLLKLSSYKPRISVDNLSANETSNQDGQVYFESLEEFHVFLLAHILQRPIIIVSDTMLHDADGEPLSPIPFGGIYLPLECEPNKCNRFPLVLAYDSAHFSALVLMNDLEDIHINGANFNEINKLMQQRAPYAIVPVCYSNNELLPVHFAYDPGEGYDWSKFQTETQIELGAEQEMYLLQRYLDLVKMDLCEPGPTAKRSNLPTNTSGLRVNVYNIRVKEPLDQEKQTTKSSSNKIQKFLNIFKKPEQENSPRKSIRSSFFKTIKPPKTGQSQPQVLSYNKIDSPKSYEEHCTSVFHRVKELNSWHEIFNSLQNQRSLLCVKLNLTKPPKYDKIISNYIESARHKFEIICQEQEQQQQQQQQQQLRKKPSFTSLANAPQQYTNHYCTVNNRNCQASNLCNNCALNVNSIRNIQIINSNKSGTSSFVQPNNNQSFSYNQINIANKAKEYQIEYDDNNNYNKVASTTHYL